MAIEKTKFVFGIAVDAVLTIGAAVSADTLQDQSTFDKSAYGWDNVAGKRFAVAAS